jgi:hypothetical protein
MSKKGKISQKDRTKTVDSNEGLSEKQKESLSELKRLIKLKYKNIPRFIRISNIPRFKFHNVIYARYDSTQMDEKISWVVDVIRKTDNVPDPPAENALTYETRIWMKMRLYNKYDNIYHFCKEHPEFKPAYLTHVFRGRKKRQCKRIDKLIQILNTEKWDNIN